MGKMLINISLFAYNFRYKVFFVLWLYQARLEIIRNSITFFQKTVIILLTVINNTLREKFCFSCNDKTNTTYKHLFHSSSSLCYQW